MIGKYELYRRSKRKLLSDMFPVAHSHVATRISMLVTLEAYVSTQHKHAPHASQWQSWHPRDLYYYVSTAKHLRIQRLVKDLCQLRILANFQCRLQPVKGHEITSASNNKGSFSEYAECVLCNFYLQFLYLHIHTLVFLHVVSSLT